MGYKSEDSKELEEEKIRYTRAQADKIELDIAIKRKEFIAVKEAEKHYSDLVYNFRNKILSLPSNIGKKLAIENDVIDCEEMLRVALEACLTDLSGNIETEKREVN